MKMIMIWIMIINKTSVLKQSKRRVKMTEERKEEIARVCLDWILDYCISTSYVNREEMLESLDISNDEAKELNCFFAIEDDE